MSWGSPCCADCPPCWQQVLSYQNGQFCRSGGGTFHCLDCRLCPEEGQSWSPLTLVQHQYLWVDSLIIEDGRIYTQMRNEQILQLLVKIETLYSLKAVEIQLCILLDVMVYLPLAQTLVVMRTFSLPSLKRSITAALCSTTISPLSSATWWPSLDSWPASQLAVFRVWEKTTTRYDYMKETQTYKYEPEANRHTWQKIIACAIVMAP